MTPKEISSLHLATADRECAFDRIVLERVTTAERLVMWIALYRLATSDVIESDKENQAYRHTAQLLLGATNPTICRDIE